MRFSRAHIYGYGRSLRPPQGTSIAPRRRAVFRQTLLEGRPDLELLTGAPDHLVGVLARPRVTAEVGGADAVGDGLPAGFADRPAGLLGPLARLTEQRLPGAD